MLILVVFLIIAAIVIFVSVGRARRRKEHQLRQVALMEASGPIRIINDSLKIIDNTKNIETLKSRVVVLEENLDRLSEIEGRGYHFTETSASEIRAKMWDSINSRIYEMSRQEFSMILSKKDSYASVKSAVTALSKVQQKLIDFREAVYSAGSSHEEIRSRIQELHDKLKEEVVIGQFKELYEKADKEEFKGNAKKARDLYLDALHLLKASGIDISRMKKEADQIEGKLDRGKQDRTQ